MVKMTTLVYFLINEFRFSIQNNQKKVLVQCAFYIAIDLLVKVANIGKQSPQRTKPLENEIGISSSGKWSDFCSIQNQLVICLSKGMLIHNDPNSKIIV